MANSSLMRSRAASMSAVTEIGSATPICGAGRPAFSAAARMTGAMCDSMVEMPVIQVTVPSATRPANFSMVSPNAATSTGGAVTSAHLERGEGMGREALAGHADLFAAQEGQQDARGTPSCSGPACRS